MYNSLSSEQIKFYNLYKQLKSCLCGHFESCKICEGKDEEDISILKIISDMYRENPNEFNFAKLKETIEFLNLPQYKKDYFKKVQSINKINKEFWENNKEK